MENNKKLLRLLMLGCRTAMKEGVFIAAAGVIACICLDTWNQIPFLWTAGDVVDVFYYWFNAFVFGGFYSVFVTPMLACIPYAASFCEEYNANILRILVSKTDIKTYCAAKSIVTAVSGGASLALGGGAFVLAASFFTDLVNRTKLGEYYGLPYYQYLQEGNGIKYFLAVIFLLFLSGMLWSSIALLVSAYIRNRYVVFAAPFLASFFLVRLNALSGMPDSLRLNMLLQARSTIGTEKSTLIITAIGTGLLVAVMDLCFYRKVKRVIKDE